MTSKHLRGPGTRVLIFDGSKGLSPTRSGSNNRYFPNTNPYKYANRSSHVTMQRSTYKELLVYRAWATYAYIYINSKFIEIKFINSVSVQKKLSSLYCQLYL